MNVCILIQILKKEYFILKQWYTLYSVLRSGIVETDNSNSINIDATVDVSFNYIQKPL